MRLKDLWPNYTFRFLTESLVGYSNIQRSDVFEYRYFVGASESVEVRRIRDGGLWHIPGRTLVEQVFLTYVTGPQLNALKAEILK